MPEKSSKSMRTDFEGFVNDVLSGEVLRNALDFAAYLRENEMIPGGTHGEITYKDKCLCYMHLDGSPEKPGPWTLWTEGDYSSEHEAVPLDGHIKETAWANVNFCASCGGGCSPGQHKVIFGKEFDNVCSASMAFHVPDAEALECVKKLLEMRKYAIFGES